METTQYPLLDTINDTADLKKLSLEQLPQLCDELRKFLIYSISQSSGHFASNLGVIELTVALHYVYTSPEDKLIWDVGHQAYAHKVLTGRKNKISTIRKYKGIHPFPFRSESIHDILSVGHSSTSLSVGLGLSIAQALAGNTGDIVPIIGDGALTAGMAFEALNHAGDVKLPMTIVFNDNNMSISLNKGAMNRHTDKIFNSSLYQSFRNRSKDLLKIEPLRNFFKNTESVVKNLFSPHIAQLFNTLGIEYIGPIDGHDVKELVNLFKKLKNNKKLQIVHVYTTKGKGYIPAEKNPIKFHGVSNFNVEQDKIIQHQNSNHQNFNLSTTQNTIDKENNNESINQHLTSKFRESSKAPLTVIENLLSEVINHKSTSNSNTISDFSSHKSTCMEDQILNKVEKSTNHSITKANPNYSKVFGDWLIAHHEDPRLVAVTPAMGEGSGMVDFAKIEPRKFIDVAIAEQHCVALAAGLAIGGFKPVIAIYSTFLQRAYDQVIHDIALDNHDVLFAIDRAGIVGEDGQTHQGAYDLAYLRCIPNLVVATPSSKESCNDMLSFGYEYCGAFAVRYPRGSSTLNQELIDKVLNKISLISSYQAKQFTQALTSSIKLGKGVKLLDFQQDITKSFVNKEFKSSQINPKVVEKGIAILSFGTMLKRAVPIALELGAALYDMRFVKPLDLEIIKDLVNYDLVVILEEGSIHGGAGSAVYEALSELDILVKTLTIGLPDKFVEPIESKYIDDVLTWDHRGLLERIKTKLYK